MKKCGKCGMIVSDDCTFCPSCGAVMEAAQVTGNAQVCSPIQVPQYMVVQAPQKPTNGVGLAGMIIGILSYILCWVPVLDFLLGMIGIILSGVGLRRKERYRLNGFAVAGLVLSIIGLVIGIIYMIAFFFLLVQTV